VLPFFIGTLQSRVRGMAASTINARLYSWNLKK